MESIVEKVIVPLEGEKGLLYNTDPSMWSAILKSVNSGNIEEKYSEKTESFETLSKVVNPFTEEEMSLLRSHYGNRLVLDDIPRREMEDYLAGLVPEQNKKHGQKRSVF